MSIVLEDRIPMRGDPYVERDCGHETPCFVWTGTLNSKGYGMWGSERAHRKMWKTENGPIPSGMCVCHRCDNPPCVRPSHLFLGTRADNNRDRAEKGRSGGTFPSGPAHPNHGAGENHPTAKLTDAQVTEIRTRHTAGETQTALALEFGVNSATVSRIVRGIWRKATA